MATAMQTERPLEGIEREIALDRLLRQQARDAASRRVDKPARELSESAIRDDDGRGRLEVLALDPAPAADEQAAESEAGEAEGLAEAVKLADRVEDYLGGRRKSPPRRYEGEAVPKPRIVLLGKGPWRRPAKGEPCPVCTGRHLKLVEVCGYCDRSGVDSLLMPAGWVSSWSSSLRPADPRPAPEPTPKPTTRARAAGKGDPLLMDRKHKPTGFRLIDAMREQRRGRVR